MAFESTAKYYDALALTAHRLEREGPLLRAWLADAPGTRVLDLACGTGIHALLLAEAGTLVTAVDLSEDMIAYASAVRPHPNIDYRVGDLRRPPEGEWDLALCLGNSISLLASRDDLESAFAHVVARLAPGGCFALQVLNYLAPTHQQPRHRVVYTEMGGTPLMAVKNLVPHEDRTLLSMAFFVDRGGDLTSVAESAVLRNWTHRDLEHIAEATGLQVAQRYGGYDRSAFSPQDSGDLILVLRKGAA